MARIASLLGLLLLLQACSHQPRTETGKDPIATRGPHPSASLDATRGDDLTTIELLKEKAEEIVSLKQHTSELEQGIKEAGDKAVLAEKKSRDMAGEVSRLRDLLARATKAQTQLNQRVLSLEIGKLKLEKKILNMKLAELAAGGK